MDILKPSSELIQVMSHQRKWTAEDRRFLAHLRKKKKMQVKDIAVMMGRTECSVWKQLSYLEMTAGVPRHSTRKPSAKDKEEASRKNALRHGWNMRPEDRPKFREKMAALNQVEQALNAMRNSNVSIS
ncbi:hypothetical protein [Nitrosomonas eutropha]|uniref:Uncharacterized protein n=2 Tax=Nitrosomonas eutropha TaxID=916 RepID=A0ABX5M9N0_9PROT|nr:hypothetical protein [Nitrosomonas eutropha]ABI59741.1 hypothetical protein Neut_1496 [Nitrosomonas eutropha C91]PXV82458.1 hypothetical protein C8R14_10730 [Nitrosomonas eutropha]